MILSYRESKKAKKASETIKKTLDGYENLDAISHLRDVHAKIDSTNKSILKYGPNASETQLVGVDADRDMGTIREVVTYVESRLNIFGNSSDSVSKILDRLRREVTSQNGESLSILCSHGSEASHLLSELTVKCNEKIIALRRSTIT
jgi:hypothetical protein